MVKKVVLAAMMLAGFWLFPQAGNAAMQGINTEGGLYVTNCESWVSLRSYASTEAPVLARIPLGTRVNIIDDNDPCYRDMVFAHVQYQGKRGYVLYNYLTAKWTMYRVVNCNEWISLRTEPSTEAKTAARIPRGELVRLVKPAENGFYYVEYNGILGYALSHYLD